MKVRLLFLITLLSGIWLTAPGVAASGVPFDLSEPTTLLKLSEAGGPTLAVVLSIYWLRDSYQRRAEESQRYADSLLTLKREYREELTRLYERSQDEAKRYSDGLEALLTRRLPNPRRKKEVSHE